MFPYQAQRPQSAKIWAINIRRSRRKSPSHADHELRKWKQTRKQRSKIPWRQLALMASLCFGIASLVLPDSVNDNLDWVLYGLMGASLYAGLGRWLA